ncbi:hypothetical protein [Haloterrigena alkaliphila]|uniref:Uncharacterized protein n=1 Tax=Haloterrigena alkaliphila TaxID=2816475 RepID=A0A8A2VBX3_9EURY|nr:hypothetical protein [Haloterrigena alkaliphila]QSW98217.1 hypothetical protein J0X25_12470 [Haloterrigena alkaliphila]
MNRRKLLLILGLLVLVGSYLVAAGVVDPTDEPAESETIDSERLVQPEANGSYIWPYTSRARSIDGRTLAINFVVHGSDERVRRALVDEAELEWQPAETETDGEAAPENETNETNETNRTGFENRTRSNDWDDAHGSIRYTYVDTGPHGGDGRWIKESYQLHRGTYMGSRIHIRAYTTDHDDWTAIQAHREYWDWFRLRHTVTDIQDSRNTLEAEFLDEPYVDEVRREYHGTHKGWNDGWLSVVELVPAIAIVLVGGVASLLSTDTSRELWRSARRLIRWAYRNVRGFVLATALAGLVLGVRSAALAAEAAITSITPQAFVVVLYPLLVIGLPVTTILLTRPLEGASRFVRVRRVASWLGAPLEPQPAFAFTAVGVGTGFILDFVGLGVTALPVELLLHRVGLVVALGIVAAGSARNDAEGAGLLALGLVGWCIGLAMPLLGYL